MGGESTTIEERDMMFKTGTLALFATTLLFAFVSCGGDELSIKKKAFAYTPLTCSGTLDRAVDISTETSQALSINDCTKKGHLDYECLKYANYTWRPWRMLFSQNVKSVKLYFSKFRTEYGWDKLFFHNYEAWHGIGGYHGSAPPINQYTTSGYNVAGGGVRTGYLDFIWTADYLYNDKGYKISHIRTTCNPPNSTQVNDVWVQRNYPYDGYLLGTGDVIYVWTRQPPGYDLGILVWPNESTHNIDLHVSATVQKPGWGSTWNSTYGTGYPDMVVIPASACPASGGVECDRYIAIASKSGKGQFRFYANVHTNNLAYGNQTFVARTNFQISNDPEKPVIRTQMRKISQAIYFATDGRHLVNRWYMYWNLPSHPFSYPHPSLLWTYAPNCDAFCSQHAGARGFPCGTGGNPSPVSSPNHVEFCQNTWNGWGWYTFPPANWYNEAFALGIGTHEIGHCMYGLGDEYHSTNNCGHSVMRAGAQSVASNHVDFCTFYNGGKDPEYPHAGHSAADNNWDCLKNRLPNFVGFPSIDTPDAFTRTSSLTNEAPFNNNLVQIIEY